MADKAAALALALALALPLLFLLLSFTSETLLVVHGQVVSGLQYHGEGVPLFLARHPHKPCIHSHESLLLELPFQKLCSCRHNRPNTIQPGSFPPEVITYDQWTQQKPETKPMFSGWLKGAFGGGKKEMQESIQQNLNFILSTAPIWDRLELKGNKYVLGEFLEFKGKPEDLHALRNIKRSKVSRLIIQKTSMLGLAHSTLQVLYSPRDYRSEGASASEWKEVCVRSSTEVVFQPQNSTKVRKFKLSSVTSTSLSA
ncbi:uncharacterized protein LOC133777789 [Humulus lupulus]|uniref:uncharacterized protein LOC133777789 n=1 Tax=Humulus lupulus TaxID=3486 RepID=UPI002B408415|nr:uncharacterized protein LOC133777789 [Humulus lupulus]